MTYPKTALSSLAEVRSGGGAPQDSSAFSETGHPFVRAGSLANLLNGSTEDELEKIEPSTAEKYRLKLLPAGTVLFAKSGMSATKGLIYCLKNPAYVVNHLAALIPHDGRDSQFLVRALEQFSPTSLIKDPAYPSIRLGDIRDFEIIAPENISERTRISAILDQADTLRHLRQTSIARLNELEWSIFYKMFGDVVSNSKGWDDQIYLGEIAEIVSGITKGRKVNGKPTRDIPYLAVVNVQDRELRLNPLKTIEATEEEIRRYRLQRNDLLLTEGGDPDKLGRGTLWNDEIHECIHQNHVFRVRLTDERIEPVFLNWLVGSNRGKQYFFKSAKQTTGIASINITQLRGLPLIAPPLKIQQDFALRISGIDEFKRKQITSYESLDSLFRSLQQRAFRGEL